MELGERIQAERDARNLTLETFGKRCGWDKSMQSKLESGKERMRAWRLEKIAAQLGVGIGELIRDGSPPIAVPDNPKPYCIDNIVHRGAYRIVGNDASPLHLVVRYDHKQPYQYPSDVEPFSAKLLAEAEQRKGYFTTPCARLITMHDEQAQLPNGEEARRTKLLLGPVTWDQYSVMHEYLRRPLFDNEPKTIIERHADMAHMFETGGDMSEIRLTQCLSVNMVIVSADGYGFFHRRATRNQMSTGVLSGMINENMHRFHDEAISPTRLTTLFPERSKEDAKRLHVDHYYKPVSVPSPVLTARRGLGEEATKALLPYSPEDCTNIHFLNMAFTFLHRKPVMIGVIQLPIGRSAIESLIRSKPGIDHREWAGFFSLRLSVHNTATRTLLEQDTQWSATGRAALISALHYWESVETGEFR